MIRIGRANLRNIVGCAKNVHASSPFVSSKVIFISKRFETTKILEIAKKIADNETQMLEKERQIEVSIYM